MDNKLLLALIAGFTVSMTACTTTRSANAGPGKQPAHVKVRVVDGPVILNRTGGDTDPNEILCKRIRMIGSHFHRITCGTRAEWEAQQHRAQEMMRQIR